MPTTLANQSSWTADRPDVGGLTTRDRKPNLLIHFSGGGADRAIQILMQSCGPSVHMCRLPGPLVLPLQRSDTWLLVNASALTPSQQMCLHDWMSEMPGQIQMVSVVREPLYPLVERGQFLERLFYRLNTISLEIDRRS